MTAAACQHRVNTPVHSPVRMHNHTNHYSVNDDNVNIKSGGRKEQEEEGSRERWAKNQLEIVIVSRKNGAIGRGNVQFNFDELH